MNGHSQQQAPSAMGDKNVDSVFGAGEQENKKRKTQAKTKPAFKPQPIKASSSTTNTTTSEIPITNNIKNIPPPPSEKRIARRRESTRAIRERDRSESPSQPPAKVQKTGTGATGTGKGKGGNGKAREVSVVPGMEGGNLAEELGGERGRWDGAIGAGVEKNKTNDLPHLDFLQFPKITKPRPSAPRPSSPPRHFFPPSSNRNPSAVLSKSTSMAPPTSTHTRKSRQSVRGGLEISTDSTQPIPISDTPVIRKNQEMRKEAQRRSSLGMRGQRASSSLGRGEISIPHKSVPTETFYKHISSHTPEPIRVRHLLVWCAKRALDGSIPSESKSKKSSKSKSKSKVPVITDGDLPRTVEGDTLISQILDEFMGNLGRGGVDTNVFAPTEDTAFSGQLRAHPANVTNRQLEAKEEGIVKRARNEDAQWTSLIRRANAKQAETSAHLIQKMNSGFEPDLSKSDEWVRTAFELAEEIIGEGEGDLTSLGEFSDVEYKIDTLHQSSHALLQYSLQATNFLDGIFTTLSSDLKKRETIGLPTESTTNDTDLPDATTLLTAARQASSSTSTSKSRGQSSKNQIDPIGMLRALANAEAKYQNDDTVKLAASLPPVPASGSIGAAGAVGVGGMTPKRPVGVTPRRTGTLQASIATTMTPGTVPSSRSRSGGQ